MSLRDEVERELTSMRTAGASLPATLQASDSAGVSVRIELTVLDTLGCAFTELVMFVPSLQSSGFDTLKKWAADLSGRLTYLLENIGPLEFDPAAGQVLIRSTPPSQLPGGTRYYEIVLSSSGGGAFVLRRFESVAGQPGRSPVDIQVTHEVLLRLIQDLVDTIPARP